MTLRNVDQERQRLDDLQRRIDDAKRHLADIDSRQDEPGEIPYREKGHYEPVDENIVPG
jgi:hypothetical protein